MLDAVEEPNTSKLQTLPSGSLYWEEREGNLQMSTMQEKKNTHTHKKEFSNRWLKGSEYELQGRGPAMNWASKNG